MKSRTISLVKIAALITLILIVPSIAAAASPLNMSTSVSLPGASEIYKERKDLFDKISAISGIAWYNLAAVDQYERTLNTAHPKTRPQKSGLIAIHITDSEWAGLINPNQDDTNEKSIAIFNGMGKDGSGDGLAELSNDLDVLYSYTSRILLHGYTNEDFRIGLWKYYQNSRSVKRIEQFSQIYAKFDTLNLDDYAFPLPLRSDYSYRSTWGASRGWGGSECMKVPIFLLIMVSQFGVPAMAS